MYKKTLILIIISILFILLIPSASFSLDHDESSFPRTDSSYEDSDLESLGDIILHRMKVEPINIFVSLIFLLAIIHTMFTSQFIKLSHRIDEKYKLLIKNGKVDKDSKSVSAEIFHLLGEVEVVFGIWTIALGVVITIFYDWYTFTAYINNLHYGEPLFIIVIMTIASSRPVLKFFEVLFWRIIKKFGGSLEVWWLMILIGGPILGSFITEPAAMAISAHILAEKVYNLGPSRKLRYATLALLFVNISIGGSLTNFAATPILMVAEPWDWSIIFMFFTFGWKALVAIVISTTVYFLYFRKEFASMHEAFDHYKFKKYIQKKCIRQKDLERDFDELSLIVSENTKFLSELSSYSHILKERIKENATADIPVGSEEFIEIENAIEEKFDTIQLKELKRIVPGLLHKNLQPKYLDPDWDQRAAHVPLWIMNVHLGFLVWTIINSHSPALFIGGFLFYLGFFKVTSFNQNRLDLKPALLVAFFLAGIIIHGTLQSWWISPLLANLSPININITSIVLTAFNDNAAITYLSTLVPNFSEELKYSLVSGAITGGGLTIIANAPNPVGQSILKKHFTKGISAFHLLKYALIPTIITSICFYIL